MDTAVTAADGNAASRWEVTVTEAGSVPPTVGAPRPAISELAADETGTLELEVLMTDGSEDVRKMWM